MCVYQGLYGTSNNHEKKNIWQWNNKQYEPIVFHVVIPQHQKIYQSSLEYHMQSTDVDYIHNSYSRSSGYPAIYSQAIKFQPAHN